MGGDEFVVIAPGLRQSDTQKVYSRISAAAAASVKGLRGSMKLSASIGIAFYPDDTTHPAQLLVEADKRMYAMKNEHLAAGSLAIPSEAAMAL